MEKSPFVFFDLTIDQLSSEKTLYEGGNCSNDRNQKGSEAAVIQDKESKLVRIYSLKYDLISSGMMCVSSYSNYGNFFLGSEGYLKNYGGCPRAFGNSWLSKALKMEMSGIISQNTQNHFEVSDGQDGQADAQTIPALSKQNPSKPNPSKVFQNHSNMIPQSKREEPQGSKSVMAPKLTA